LAGLRSDNGYGVASKIKIFLVHGYAPTVWPEVSARSRRKRLVSAYVYQVISNLCFIMVAAAPVDAL
jgi:hypothetical protein